MSDHIVSYWTQFRRDKNDKIKGEKKNMILYEYGKGHVQIFKKIDRARAENYRPVSLPCVCCKHGLSYSYSPCCKILEHVLHSQVMKHLDEYNVLTKFQHGFRRGHSCESHLIQTMHDLCSSRDKRLQIDMLVLDFSKAFDTVPHHRLMLKLSNYGISGSTHKWISSFLQDRLQRVVVGGEHSEWSRVVSGVPQGTVLGPLLFPLYIKMTCLKIYPQPADCSQMTLLCIRP